MVKLQNLLNNSKKVLNFFKFLKINKKQINFFSKEIKNNNLHFKESKDFLNLDPIFYLLIDSLNFCFWNFNDNQIFSYLNKFNSVALAYKIKENLKYANPKFLYKNSEKFYKLLLKNTKGNLLLEKQRILIIKQIGKFLIKNDFYKILSNFNNKDVDLLANFLVRNLPYVFLDVSYKNGFQLNFFKKIRLLISDLISLAGFEFKNQNKLLIFPDYGLPALFIYKNIIELDKKYLNKILNKKIIKKNSDLEIALRSATVVVGSLIKENFKDLFYNQIDRLLWIFYERNKNKIIHHRTLTRFY
ncbi:MAG: queuosine salvage family protein [Patescibacteria group bacterium]|nr:queuosine salvage family protein [Patescibacteria group bacterium]MCX7589518.1 queuosine salvage family protein [Patescibacteria group bacterium]MDW8279940.1 queuosine salvage family protein [bacterium]